MVRQGEQRIRWQSAVRKYETDVSLALEFAELGCGTEELEAATRRALASELGPGHAVVMEGKAQILRLRKQRSLASLRERENRFVEAWQQACEGHADVEAVMRDGAATLGPAHPAVEAAREALKLQRFGKWRSDWEMLVAQHRLRLEEARAAGDPERYEARITAAANALGLGHPVVCNAQRLVLKMRKEQRVSGESRVRAQWGEKLQRLAQEAEEALEQLRREEAAETLAAPRLGARARRNSAPSGRWARI